MLHYVISGRNVTWNLASMSSVAASRSLPFFPINFCCLEYFFLCALKSASSSLDSSPDSSATKTCYYYCFYFLQQFKNVYADKFLSVPKRWQHYTNNSQAVVSKYDLYVTWERTRRSTHKIVCLTRVISFFLFFVFLFPTFQKFSFQASGFLL